MDFKQLLPILLKGRLGEKEQALLKLTENPDPSALGTLLTRMYDDNKKPQHEIVATFKKIIPAELLGSIIKYFDARKRSARR